MKSKLKNYGLLQFFKLCKQLQTEKQFEEFFDLFLTAQEREAINNRVLLVKALIKGEKTQREIAADLNISIAKITRGSNYLKTISKELRKFLETQL